MVRRSGRKRKAEKREPNGRVQRKREDVRDVCLRQPHRAKLPEKERFSQLAESELGRLRLAGLVTERQYEAGAKYASLCRQLHVVLVTPRTVRSAGFEYVPDATETPADADYLSGDPEAEEDRTARVLKALDAAHRALAAPRYINEVRAVCDDGKQPVSISALGYALECLAHHWRL